MTSIKTEDDYTKQEKTIYLNPTAALAAAVIRQWRLDGCPDSSKKEIDMWQAIYNDAVKLKDRKTTYDISRN